MTGAVFDAASQVPGAYEPGRWWVSPASRTPEVVGDAPRSVVVRDITMRTVEQMAGVSMPKRDRHVLLRAIVASGVPEVMSTSTYLGTRSVDEVRKDVELVREASPDCKIVFNTVKGPEDIALAVELGYDMAEIASNFLGEATYVIDPEVYRRLWADRSWDDIERPTTAQAMIARSVGLVRLVKEAGMPCCAGLNLIAKQTDAYVTEFADAVAAAGADEIAMYDGSSSMSPEAFAHAVRVVKQAAPSVRVAVHTHDFLGLGLACSLASVLAGADVVEVAVNGYHLAYGQGDLASTAVALEALYGIPTGIDLKQLTGLSRLAEELVGVAVPAYQPIVGRELFALGGEYTSVDPLLHNPITPQLVGGRFVTPERG